MGFIQIHAIIENVTGYKKTRIILDKEIDRWKITNLKDEVAILEMVDKQRLPIGGNEWKVPSNICRDGRDVRNLVITSCNETEFNCKDGNCIAISER